MEDMKKGRPGGREGAAVFRSCVHAGSFDRDGGGNVVQPGNGFNIDPATLDAKAVTAYAGQAKAQSITDFVMHIIPATVVDAFARGDILQVLLVAILFGFALSLMGPRCRPLVELFDALTHGVFGIINILMRLAPIGAFGAMAYTIGTYGLASLGPLLKLIVTFYPHLHSVRCGGAGLDCLLLGLQYFQVPAVHQGRDAAGAGRKLVGAGAATLMEKMQSSAAPRRWWDCGADRYTFNTDGTSMYMTLAALFVAQATNIHLTFGQQLTIFAVAVLTSKGASGVAGRGVHRSGGHADGDSYDPRRGHGYHSGNRPLHEHVPSLDQHAW